jgi:diguanylate cyclase (GGDEF)-like protein
MRVLSGFKVSAIRRWLLAAGAAAFTPVGIVVSAALLWLVMVGLCIVMLVVSRQDAYDHAIQDSRNLTLVLERDILRSIEFYDLSLRAVAEGAADPRIMSLPKELRDMVLFDRAATARFLGPITVFTPDGTAQVCSIENCPQRCHRPDVRWFVEQTNRTDMGLWISSPYVSRTAGGLMVLALSRRISRPDGGFGGVVVGRLSVDYFRYLLDGLSMGNQSAVTVFETNGTLLARFPHEPAVVGKDFRRSPVFVGIMQEEMGSFVATATHDGVRRLYVYRRIRGLPFVVSVAPALTEVYAGWASRAEFVAVLMALFTVVMAVGAWALVSELRRRQLAKAKLQRMAHRDALTGLENRGTFDDVWNSEYLRSKRNGRPLSLLFIDIDHFKSYNDYYGHQAGDACLKSVAGCIAACVHRPGDHVARYGGEEFVVVLPETDAGTAFSIAEEIRRAIGGLEIEHIKSRFGTVSVSIGTASSADADIADATALIKAADMATYDAKARGRNRVCRHAAPDGFSGDASRKNPATRAATHEGGSAAEAAAAVTERAGDPAPVDGP